jgi:hypothetical protein
LLEANGNIYAAFGSFCDFDPGISRGWLLGWNAATLTRLSANELTDSLGTASASWRKVSAGNNLKKASPTNATSYFLSSIWMSGYGPADDEGGNIFFSTGNSDPKVNTYTGTTNIQESVVKMPEDLTSVTDLFTPSNSFVLDQEDADVSSGGVLILPDQPGPLAHLAVAAGKDGRLFILNRDDMGGFHNPDVPANVYIGNCWCGPSYYQGSDGVGRVITSGGGSLPAGGATQSRVQSWTINTTKSPALVLEAMSIILATTPQESGFFTTISSNGTNANTAIIWAIGRPTGNDNHITLYAFNGTKSGGTLPLLWSGNAGFWPNLSADANLVPTVANGMVYVASYKQLAIFGLTPPTMNTAARLQVPAAVPALKPSGALFWGRIKSIQDARLVLVLRNGEVLQVDISEALKGGTSVTPVIGENVAVNGKFNEHGVMQAHIMWRAKGPKSWSADRRG